MKISMFVNPSAPHDTMPKLKGRAIEVRNLMPALAHVWEHFMVPGLLHEEAVLCGLKSSAEMDEILATFPDADVLPKIFADQFNRASWTYARAQNACASFYNEELKLMLFDATIKTHWMLHQALTCGFLNPRKSWNFAGEDFMQKIKTLLASCTRGNCAAQSTVKLVEKWCYGMHHQFLQIEESLFIDEWKKCACVEMHCVSLWCV